MKPRKRRFWTACEPGHKKKNIRPSAVTSFELIMVIRLPPQLREGKRKERKGDTHVYASCFCLLVPAWAVDIFIVIPLPARNSRKRPYFSRLPGPRGANDRLEERLYGIPKEKGRFANRPYCLLNTVHHILFTVYFVTTGTYTYIATSPVCGSNSSVYSSKSMPF